MLVEHFASLHAHGEWADARLLRAVEALPGDASTIVRELAHVRAAQEIWLARLEHRTTRQAIWPTWSVEQLAQESGTIGSRLREWFSVLTPETLLRDLEYHNLAGDAFRTPVADVLTHLLLHGQYHRGKANVALRDAGAPAVGIDFIVWQREQPTVDRIAL